MILSISRKRQQCCTVLTARSRPARTAESSRPLSRLIKKDDVGKAMMTGCRPIFARERPDQFAESARPRESR